MSHAAPSSVQETLLHSIPTRRRAPLSFPIHSPWIVYVPNQCGLSHKPPSFFISFTERRGGPVCMEDLWPKERRRVPESQAIISPLLPLVLHNTTTREGEWRNSKKLRGHSGGWDGWRRREEEEESGWEVVGWIAPHGNANFYYYRYIVHIVLIYMKRAGKRNNGASLPSLVTHSFKFKCLCVYFKSKGWGGGMAMDSGGSTSPSHGIPWLGSEPHPNPSTSLFVCA